MAGQNDSDSFLRKRSDQLPQLLNAQWVEPVRRFVQNQQFRFIQKRQRDAEPLRKEFNRRTVVRNVSLHVKRNSVYGLLGPNGAGKSTTLKMLTGMLRPTSGTIEFNGHRWERRDLARMLSNVGESRFSFIGERVARFIFEYGDRFYAFQGLLCKTVTMNFNTL